MSGGESLDKPEPDAKTKRSLRSGAAHEAWPVGSRGDEAWTFVLDDEPEEGLLSVDVDSNGATTTVLGCVADELAEDDRHVIGVDGGEE